MMKIDTQKKLGHVSKANKKQKSNIDKSDSSFSSLLHTSDIKKGSDTASTEFVRQVDSLLSVQEVDSRGSSKKKVISHGEELLEELEKLKLSILSGELSEQQLQNLSKKLCDNNVLSDDAALNEILHEIELRVEVELAKRAFKRA